MRKILVLAPYVPHPLTHGGSIRTRLLLDAIAADHEVHLVAPVASDAERTNVAVLAATAGIQVHPVEVPAAPRPGFAQKLASWARGRSELLQRRWGDAAAAVVATLASKLRPAAVVADSSFVFPVLPPFPAPLVLHLHNLEGGVFARPSATKRTFSDRLTRSFEARTITALETRKLREAALTITVSDLDREVALTMAPGARIVTVPVTVDLAKLPLLPPTPVQPGPLRVLFVGTIDYPPNFEAIEELVVQHLPVLRATFPGLVARLVGRDDADRLGVFRGRDGVEVVGTVADVKPHYEVSHAVYLPIRTGGGTRGKIVEAWALGRPVLATAVGAEALLGEEGRHWRRFEAPAQGAQVLREVLLGGGAAGLVRAGRALVEAHYQHAAAFAALRAAIGSVVSER
ncbi:MAG: glycosyltransferase [Planctomycetes bacterium]|nr:glycosyltransferase [Planctomycetota bacterium]